MDVLLVAMFVLWIPLFIGVTIYEIRRFYLLYHYFRGDATREDLPPLREELPEVSLREIAAERLRRSR